jgi:hypothetical protein
MRTIKALGCFAALAISVGTTVSHVDAAADTSTAPVTWHAQKAPLSGLVEGASAHLVRTDNGISYQLHATNLTPGHAYTLWQVVVNNPSACSAHPCSAADILRNAATGGQVSYGAGHIVGASGRATFAGAQSVGPIPEGWVAGVGLGDTTGAEVHLVLNDHGPALAEFMPDMIHTYRGGCSGASPFPGVFPEVAIADGAVGPNICRLTQTAIFVA